MMHWAEHNKIDLWEKGKDWKKNTKNMVQQWALIYKVMNLPGP
jgi:hypothetical protein